MALITIDAVAALAELRALQARIEFPASVLGLIGANAAGRAQERIKMTKVDPSDEAWAPWNESTRDERTKKGNVGQGLLWDRGDLLASLHVQSDQSGVSIGSDMPYAKFLQDGTGRMAARPFLGWDDVDTLDAQRTMLSYLEGSL